MTIPFISLLDLGDYLDADLTEDEVGVIAIDSACEMIRSYIDQRIDYEEQDEIRLDGTGRPSLLLPQRPVRAVHGVTEEDEGPDLAEDEDWYLDRVADRIIRLPEGAVWPLGQGNIVVNYDHGYEADPVDEDFIRVPSDIRLVALQIASRIYRGKGTATAGTVVSETIGSTSFTYESGGVQATGAAIAPIEQGILDHYRIPRLR